MRRRCVRAAGAANMTATLRRVHRQGAAAHPARPADADDSAAHAARAGGPVRLRASQRRARHSPRRRRSVSPTTQRSPCARDWQRSVASSRCGRAASDRCRATVSARRGGRRARVRAGVREHLERGAGADAARRRRVGSEYRHDDQAYARAVITAYEAELRSAGSADTDRFPKFACASTQHSRA